MIRQLLQALWTPLYCGTHYTPLRLLFVHKPPCATQVVVCAQFELQPQVLRFVKSHSLWNWIEWLCWWVTRLLINESRFRLSSAACAPVHFLGLFVSVLYSTS